MDQNEEKKQQLINNIISMRGTQDEEVSSVYWLNGHCMMLVKDEDGEWDFDEL